MYQKLRRRSLIPIPTTTVAAKIPSPASKRTEARPTLPAFTTSPATTTSPVVGADITRRRQPCNCNTCSRSRVISPRHTTKNPTSTTDKYQSTARPTRLKTSAALLPANSHSGLRSPGGRQALFPSTKTPLRTSPNIYTSTVIRTGAKGSAHGINHSPGRRSSFVPQTTKDAAQVHSKVTAYGLPSSSRKRVEFKLGESHVKCTTGRQQQPVPRRVSMVGTEVKSSSPGMNRIGAIANGSSSTTTVIPPTSAAHPLRSRCSVVFRCPQCSRDVMECDKLKVLLTECDHMMCNICLYRAFLRESGCPTCHQPLDRYYRRRAFP